MTEGAQEAEERQKWRPELIKCPGVTCSDQGMGTLVGVMWGYFNTCTVPSLEMTGTICRAAYFASIFFIINFRSCSRSFLLSPSVKQFHQLQVMLSVLPIVTICQTVSSASGHVLSPSYCHHLSNSLISFRSCSRSFLLSPSVKQFHQLQVVFTVLPIVTICQTV